MIRETTDTGLDLRAKGNEWVSYLSFRCHHYYPDLATENGGGRISQMAWLLFISMFDKYHNYKLKSYF